VARCQPLTAILSCSRPSFVQPLQALNGREHESRTQWPDGDWSVDNSSENRTKWMPPSLASVPLWWEEYDGLTALRRLHLIGLVDTPSTSTISQPRAIVRCQKKFVRVWHTCPNRTFEAFSWVLILLSPFLFGKSEKACIICSKVLLF